MAGFWRNNSDQLARTVLGVMVKCIFGGPEFVIQMMSVRDLTAEFQFQQVQLMMNNLQNAFAR